MAYQDKVIVVVMLLLVDVLELVVAVLGKLVDVRYIMRLAAKAEME